MTKWLWVGDDPDSLFCETAEAASYFLEMPHRVCVPDFPTARKALDLIGMPRRKQDVLMVFAGARWHSGVPD